jgi:hypothetical protein
MRKASAKARSGGAQKASEARHVQVGHKLGGTWVVGALLGQGACGQVYSGK